MGKQSENISQKGDIERHYLAQGLIVAGVDEVGRGCLAGPVVTAAVILDFEKLQSLDEKEKGLIRDSKLLSAKQRDKALSIIENCLISSSISVSDARVIDDIGILKATFKTMIASIRDLSAQPNMVLVDGHLEIPNLELPQRAIIKGDQLCYCIAAASIIAKVHRDQLMQMAAVEFPDYGFDRNVGYGTATHLAAITKSGPCTIHRKSFEPIKSLHTSAHPN